MVKLIVDGFFNSFQYVFNMSNLFGQDFRDREKWHKWLENNHATEKEIWVIIQKKKSLKKGLKYQEAVEEAICFGWIDSKMQSIDAETFRQRFSPRRRNSIWSKKNKESAKKMIKEKKMKDAGFATIEIAKQNGKWDAAYSSNMVMTIPKDLQKALMQNKLTWKNFNNFSNSAKLQYIYWINDAKKEETIQKRINEVVKKASQNS
jgi:uncharacterized protein YdeI (YjbR/CyaY-like superfamily)